MGFRFEGTLLMPTPKSAEVNEAERRIGNVLAELEGRTGSDVQGISLEELVDTDPATGRPAVHKGVEITVTPRPQRRWVR